MFKSKIETLKTAIINADNQKFVIDDLSFVNDFVKNCSAYVKEVVDMESVKTSACFRLEGQEYRDFIMNLDKTRKSVHDVCIANINMINRICVAYKCEPVFKDSYLALDRTALADQIIKPIVDEYFDERQR